MGADIQIILNMLDIRKPLQLKIVPSFSNLEFVKNILCVPQKKYCNQNKYQINQNLVLRVWFALLTSRHKNIFPEFWKFLDQLFSPPKITLGFRMFVKKPSKISFPNVK